MEQGTPEWFAARAGKLTASRLQDAVAKTRNGWAASRANLIAVLVTERLTGEPAATYSNAAMQWGTEQEPHARAEYEIRTGSLVDEVGFVDHPDIPMSGASPDGLVGGDGLIEIKCPNTATHIETLLGAPIPAKYRTQMQWQMACTGRQWCDFVSYDPRLPERMQLHIQRVERDDDRIGELEEAAAVFLAEVAEKVNQLTEQFKEAA